jgi:hypothetical protein
MLVDAVQQYWVNFATTGSPCSTGKTLTTATPVLDGGCAWKPAISTNQSAQAPVPSEVRSLVVGQQVVDIMMAEYRPGSAAWFSKWKGGL